MKQNFCPYCKFIKYEMYEDSSCKAIPHFNKESATFSLYRAKQVRAGKKVCPYYKPNFTKKIKALLTAIRIAYYKWRQPELFIQEHL